MGTFALQDYQHKLASMLEPGMANGPFAGLRQQGLKSLLEQGLPGPKTEDWKYTPVRELVVTPLCFAQPGSDTALDIALPEWLGDNVAVMVNGRLRSDLSRLHSLPAGVTVTDVHGVPDESPASTAYPIGDIAALRRHPFAALNSACFDAGLVVDVQAGVRVKQPLVILWLTAGTEPIMVSPRLRIQLGEGARLSLAEHHQGSRLAHLHNKVGEISLEAGAHLEHLQIQQTAAQYHINGTHVRCNRDSHYQCSSLDLDGNFIRNDLVISLVAPGAHAEATGLFTVARPRHVDNHVCVEHLAPHCDSQVLYKGVLAKGGRGVFNGKLVVHPDAQQTRARQTNHNLLLAAGIDLNAKPELEIYADDVQCSHGCTSGELDHDQLFYLLSRGIDPSPARQLLVTAFAREILDTLPEHLMFAGVETGIEQAIQQLANDRKEIV